jgi:threonine synthase
MQHTVRSVIGSNAISLDCLRCGRSTPYSAEAYLCEVCGNGTDPTDAGVLDVRYDYAVARQALLNGSGRVRSERRDLFRYLPLLPVAEVPSVLPTGGTPIFAVDDIARELGCGRLYVKDESRNPTRSLKDRATAIGTARAIEGGYQHIVCASAGNAAISMAGFAANAGIKAHAYVPRDASAVRLSWLRRFGARIERSEGDYDQAFGEAERRRSEGWYSRNCAFNPYLVEGKKTVAFEIAEQLDWRVPDVVICPVGDACTLSAVGKGFRELTLLGLTDRLPKLVGVQSAAIHPMVDRVGDRALPAPPPEASTLAASIDVKWPRNARRLERELEQSDGVVLAVGDASIHAAQANLAERAGIVAEFTSAAGLAGLRQLAESRSLAGHSAVLIITGGRPDDA